MNRQRQLEIIKQIEQTQDPESLRAIVGEYASSVSNLATAVSAEQSSILTNIIPLLTLPSPTPQSIVGWLSKLVAGIAGPQLQAQIRLTQQLAEISSALPEISTAISNSRIKINEVEGPLREVRDSVLLALSDSLVSVGQTQTLLNGVAGTDISQIDTTDVQTFLQTADSETLSLQQNITQFIAGQ